MYSGFNETLANIKWKTVLTGNNLENWKTDTNEQILYDGPALVVTCVHYIFHSSNLVEAAVDAK